MQSPMAPLTLINAITQYALAKETPSDLAIIKTSAKAATSLFATKFYVRHLLRSGSCKVEEARLLLDKALKLHYRDSDLWRLLGELYQS